MRRPKILFIFGTRPEAIKLSPVIRHLRETGRFDVRCCATAQHRGMLDQVLEVFGISPDWDLDVMLPNQSLAGVTSRILASLEPVLASEGTELVFVQGDTVTTLCGALAGFYAGIPVAHVEAGLRTGDMRQPFPEEMNRVVTGRLAALHFAATERAAANLRAEGAQDGIHVTGNTGIDAVLHVRDLLERNVVPVPHWDWLCRSRRLVVVTAHRRESFGEPFERICEAILRISELDGVQVAYPVHPNPNVTTPVNRIIAGRPNIHLLPPLDYFSFVDLARRAHLLITDSGGIQEEGPSLGKPVLVLREKTERPEAVEAGTAILVGADPNRIVDATVRLLTSTAEYERMTRIHNPYGDGHASERIAEATARFLKVL